MLEQHYSKDFADLNKLSQLKTNYLYKNKSYLTIGIKLKSRKKFIIVTLVFTICCFLILTSPSWIPFIIYPVSSFEECFRINSISENYVNQPLQNDTSKSPHYEYTVNLTAVKDIHAARILVDGQDDEWIGNMNTGENTIVLVKSKDKVTSISASCSEMTRPQLIESDRYY